MQHSTQPRTVCMSLPTSQFNHPGQVQKLQSIIASRASQYSHDAKRKEREAAKLKERLSQLLVDRKDKKLGKYKSSAKTYTHCSFILGVSEQNYTFFASLFFTTSYRCTQLLGEVRWKKEPLEDCKSDSQVP